MHGGRAAGAETTAFRARVLGACALLVLSAAIRPAHGAPPRTGSDLPIDRGPWGSGLDPSGVAIGDLDRDGNADIVVAYHATGKVNVCLGDGNGAFEGIAEIEAEIGIREVAIGFLGEGRRPFLAVLSPKTESLLLFVREEEGAFARLSPPAPTGKGPASIAIGYRDEGETEPFVAVVNETSHDLTVCDLSPAGVPAVRTVDLKLGGQPEPTPVSVASGDFDIDGRADDLAIVNRKYETVTILLRDDDGGFERKYKDFHVRSNPSDIAACAVGDAREPLLAVANRMAREATLYARREGSAFGFRELGEARSAGGLVSVSLTEVGTMGTALLAVAGRVRGEVTVFLVEPGGGTTLVGAYPADEAVRAVAVGCLSGRNKPFAVAAGRRLYPIPLFAE